MNVFEIVSDNCESKNYLAESWNILTEQQRSVLRECERELWPLIEELVSLFESRLRPEAIEKLFTAAEEQSQGKLTGAGKAAKGTKDAAKLGSDTIKKINAKINELGKKLQDTEPVQNFDSQFEKLKQDIKQKAGDDSKIIKQVEKYGDWAKQNPGKTAFVIGVLTAAAAFAGGPAGGAAVGFLLRSANEITKGEKASSAAGKAAKTAAVGALAGVAAANVSSAVTDAVAEMGVNEIDAAREAFTQANLEDAMADVEATYGDVIPDEIEDYSKLKGSVSLNSFSYDFDVYMSPEQVQEYQSLSDAWQSAELGTTENREAFLKVVDFVEGVADDPEQITLRQYSAALEAAQDAGLSTEQVNQLSGNLNDLADQIDAMSEAEPKIAAAVQAAAQQADEIKKQEPEVSESVNEDLKDRIKGAAGNVKKQAAQAVTKQKLMKAWQKQGKPLDYGSIINIMQSAGLKKDEIEKVARSAKVELPMRSQDKNIKPGQTVQGPDGESYNWKGAQWVNDKTGRVARKDLAQQLSQTAKSDRSSNAETQADANSGTGTDVEKLAQQIKQAGLTDRVKQYLDS
jgi:hypothetical protein